ncbi:MAG: polyphosphate polymerase domain-containing protein [Dysgonamonadaceae bacterium]|jgi:hypothetical protein|nr:polyphosphate polymerase domain-containing protein [Dysgonamonadaceae bacterium]
MNIPINDIEALLAEMRPVTLAEMKDIHLMDRVDFKYVTSAALLPPLLKEMASYFKIQVNNGKRIAPYTTQYLDTADLKTFVIHQNGRLNRQKIRIRTYVDSAISFLEIKNKNNKGRTSKIRIPVHRPAIDTVADLEGKDRQFITENSLFDSAELKPSLGNTFDRITFVNNKSTERVTIDLNLSFRNYNTEETLKMNGIVVLELKQAGRQASDFREILSRLRIKELSFSKYCMGTVLTDPNIKYNRFKKKWITINKITL